MSTPAPMEALSASAVESLDHMLSRTRLHAVRLQPGEHVTVSIHRGEDGAISVTVAPPRSQRETYRVGR